MWYKYALRKHYLKFDPRVIINNNISDPNLDAVLGSFISSAIIKGLDVVGFTSVDVAVSRRAKTLAEQQGVDLLVLPGQSYQTTDKFDIIIFNHEANINPGSHLEELLQYCNNHNLITLVYNNGKQKSKELIRLNDKTHLKPTLIEIFNAKSPGYLYITTNTFEVVASGVDNQRDFERSNIYSLVQRKDLEQLHIMPENYGIDYTPKYLGGS